MRIFSEFQVKNMTLRNRIVMPPMTMYRSENGLANDFHLTHYASRAIGGVSLITVEATAVAADGRITDYCMGLWSDDHIPPLQKVVQTCQSYGAKVSIQLNHAGRKAKGQVSKLLGPSPVPYDPTTPVPEEMTFQEIQTAISQFKDAAIRVDRLGADAVQVHAAHGYLLHEFLSPLSNRRSDAYGGSLKNRMRLLLEVLEEVKSAWPEEKPLFLRVSAIDWLHGGVEMPDTIQIVNSAKKWVDVVDVSSGGLGPRKYYDYPGYQVPFAEQIKRECGVPTIAVGLMTQPEAVEEVITNGRADLVALGRALLMEPYWVNNTARRYNVEFEYPAPYRLAYMPTPIPGWLDPDNDG